MIRRQLELLSIADAQGVSVISELVELAETESLDEMNQAVQLWADWHNHRPLFIIGGYTPAELCKRFGRMEMSTE